MSETVEMYKDIADHKKRLRAKYAIDCPVCKRLRPRANPSKLLPKQRCRVDGYTDPRPELTNEQWSAA